MMRLANLSDYKEAEIYLQEVIVPAFNERFGKKPQIP